MILIFVLLVSIAGAQITYYLIHKKHVSTVRASAAPTLIFAVTVSFLPVPFVGALQAAFFGATFVGMTDKSRLGWKRVLIASLVFGLVFFFLIPLVKGVGGGLGAAAFLSSSCVYTLVKLIKRYIPFKSEISSRI